VGWVAASMDLLWLVADGLGLGIKLEGPLSQIIPRRIRAVGREQLRVCGCPEERAWRNPPVSGVCSALSLHHSVAASVSGWRTAAYAAHSR
jgi:hypothetical protein